MRLCENRKGVLVLGYQESRFTRRYRTLRIPRDMFGRYTAENRLQLSPDLRIRPVRETLAQWLAA
jgi:hypothetical protein